MKKLVNRIKNERNQQEVRVSRFETLMKQLPNQNKKSLEQEDMQDIYDFDLQKDQLMMKDDDQLLDDDKLDISDEDNIIS